MIWKDVAPELASHGYRVLVYGTSQPYFSDSPLVLMSNADLYGRGYSDAPQTTYDTKLYTTQLALLMQYLKWEKALVAGNSMVRLTAQYHPGQ